MSEEADCTRAQFFYSSGFSDVASRLWTAEIKMIFSDLLKTIEGKRGAFHNTFGCRLYKKQARNKHFAKISTAFRYNSSESYTWSKSNWNHAYLVDRLKGICYKH